MKRELKILVLSVIIFGMVMPELSSAQGWGGRRKPGFWDDWSFNVNMGLSSFFGDLSIYDTEVMEKLTQESGPAFGGILTKNISRKIGVSGQLLYGNLKGENMSGQSFESSFVEYNFHVRVNFINLFSPDNISKLGIDGYAGIGQFLFKTTKWDLSDTNAESNVHSTGIPEFVYFFGLGMSYKITDKFGATVDMAMRQAQNDKLDDFNKNENNDYYSYLSVGVTYYIESFKKSKSYGKGKSTRGRMPGYLPMRRRR
ncbi:MAG: hypothetical protein JW731_16795 [Bacteroidales bacterium]|nr:hypothetical protein [Bacteroidales bacterium]